MPRAYIAIDVEGKTNVHAADSVGGNYDTLCGMDSNDPGIGIRVAGLIIGARIDCPQCIETIRTAKQYSERDFSPELRKTK